MKMTTRVIMVGSAIIIAAVIVVNLYVPWATMSRAPSEIYRPRTALEERGREIYVNNGCTYCHTQFVRNFDWNAWATRVARVGDYIADQPHLVGTERTGPDLSQAGGIHPNDWQLAHFINPRFVSPDSLMPAWKFLGLDNLVALTAYVQSLGFKMGDYRMERQKNWKKQAIQAYESGPASNVEWLHGMVPEGWRNVPNPYPTTAAGLHRGKTIYQKYCIGCHGPIGDGMGPAAPYLYPPPLNFTVVRNRGISGGILYYQIMNGITGTAMPYFKNLLESAKIWDVGDYVAVNFIGQSDANAPPKGIDAAFEPPPKYWEE